MSQEPDFPYGRPLLGQGDRQSDDPSAGHPRPGALDWLNSITNAVQTAMVAATLGGTAFAFYWFFGNGRRRSDRSRPG
ncbi:MAG: hypothetical protein M3552_12435 [Planctomycetota bacterium]|nr:hypothetical protein [Planctomycetaceae bacterium]MDQ3331441.1 hypothetical protein [Planctomycetota bacterium]